jgi:hypothetical protein
VEDGLAALQHDERGALRLEREELLPEDRLQLARPSRGHRLQQRGLVAREVVP